MHCISIHPLGRFHILYCYLTPQYVSVCVWSRAECEQTLRSVRGEQTEGDDAGLVQAALRPGTGRSHMRHADHQQPAAGVGAAVQVDLFSPARLTAHLTEGAVVQI